jgi:hypothetical protein
MGLDVGFIGLLTRCRSGLTRMVAIGSCYRRVNIGPEHASATSWAGMTTVTSEVFGARETSGETKRTADAAPLQGTLVKALGLSTRHLNKQLDLRSGSQLEANGSLPAMTKINLS